MILVYGNDLTHRILTAKHLLAIFSVTTMECASVSTVAGITFY